MTKPSSIFGLPVDVLGNPIDNTQDTWYHWLLHPRNKPLDYEFKNNLRAGISVALVNVPLSISLAIASGGDPASGVVSAVWAAGISAFACSSHFNVVGPTGALSGMLAVTAHRYGPQILPVVSILTSLWLLLFFVLRLDRYMRYVSSGVEHGFSIGVAAIIAVAQVPTAFGLTGLTPREKLLEKLSEDILHLGSYNPYDTAVFLVTFASIYLMIKHCPRVPSQILFVALGVILGMVAPEGTFTLLKTKYPTLSLSLLSPADLSKAIAQMQQTDLIMYSFGIALVALLETLVSSRIANNCVTSKEFLNYSAPRDTFGLSLTNLIVGLFGGIPATAALARTSFNIKTGAYSRVAGFVSCITVAILASILLPFFVDVPMAVIAGILMMVAYRLIDFHEMGEIYKVDTANMYSLIITATACIVTDTFFGLIVGIAVSVALNMRHFTNDSVDFGFQSFIDDGGNTSRHIRTVTARIKAPMVFNNSEDVKAKVNSAPLKMIQDDELVEELTTPVGHRHLQLVIDVASVERIDFDGAKVLGEIIELYRMRGWIVRVQHFEHLRTSLSRCEPFHAIEKLDYNELLC
ncbi:sulfate transporter, putative [Bodo saltans]|uniref:Sulfate transporter, putative n=1 Tax=Bodo saltans TaxID=75058 RepID=A0A0S4JJA6_BODSA|nr:sulfate transporter, putative [Bodo saltans]|eukprot:CUG90158.1 sulfate transporter, putative [Bodo saltans]